MWAWVRAKALPIGGAALAVVGFTATSAAQRPEVRSLAASGSTVYAEVAEDSGPTALTTWAQSTDGGETWTEVEDDSSPKLADSTESTAEACRSDGRCFAARGGSVEVKPPDGRWSTSFAFSDDERDLIDHRRPSGGAELDQMFQSVLVVDGDEGESVLVAARDQGVLAMDPDGGWRRVGVLDATPTSVNGSMIPLSAATIILFLSLPVAGVTAAVRAAAQRGAGVWAKAGSVVGAVMIAGVVWCFGIGAYILGTWTSQQPMILAGLLLVIAVAVVLLPLAFVRRAVATTPKPDA